MWDIFYYVWLKALHDWPSSLMSRDLLFLIPVPWVGPVWAPCLISQGLIVLALVVLRGRSRMAAFRVDGWSWTLLMAGALLMVASFTIDPLLKVEGLDALSSLSTMGDAGARALMRGRAYIPERYPWPWLAAGMALALAGLARLIKGQRAVWTARC